MILKWQLSYCCTMFVHASILLLCSCPPEENVSLLNTWCLMPVKTDGWQPSGWMDESIFRPVRLTTPNPLLAFHHTAMLRMPPLLPPPPPPPSFPLLFVLHSCTLCSCLSSSLKSGRFQKDKRLKETKFADDIEIKDRKKLKMRWLDKKNPKQN